MLVVNLNAPVPLAVKFNGTLLSSPCDAIVGPEPVAAFVIFISLTALPACPNTISSSPAGSAIKPPLENLGAVNVLLDKVAVPDDVNASIYVLTSDNATWTIVPLSFTTTRSASTNVVGVADVSLPSSIFNSVAVEVIGLPPKAKLPVILTWPAAEIAIASVSLAEPIVPVSGITIFPLKVAVPASLPSSVKNVVSTPPSVPLNIISLSLAAASIVIFPLVVESVTAASPAVILSAAIAEAEAALKLNTPEPSVFNTWPSVPSAKGNVNVKSDVRLALLFKDVL